MSHTIDSRGIKPQGVGNYILAKGKYLLEITKAEEGWTGKSKFKVTVDSVVRKPEQFDGHTLRFHTVTFMLAGEPGAGIAIHFLKTIGEPWGEQEKLEIEPTRWIGKRFWAEIDSEDYTANDGTVKLKNVIGKIEPATEADKATDAEVPANWNV